MSHKSHKQHFAILDGLRGVAALVVVALHLTQRSTDYFEQHGYLAVDFFFILSGFVIAYAYEGELKKGLSVREFCRIRLVRLYPMVLLGSSIGAAVFFLRARSAGISPAEMITAGLSGILLLPQVRPLPGFTQTFPTNVPQWSLLVELLVNLAFAFAAPLLTTKRLIAATILSGLALIATAWQFGSLNMGMSAANMWAGLPRGVFPFLAGVLIYRFRPKLALGAGAALLAAAVLFLFLAAPTRQSLLHDLAGVFLVFPFIVCVGATATCGNRLSGIFLFAGLISYPVYILHMPFVYLVRTATASLSGPALVMALLLSGAAILALSFLALRYYDEPVRRWLNKRLPRIR